MGWRKKVAGCQVQSYKQLVLGGGRWAREVCSQEACWLRKGRDSFADISGVASVFS